MTNEEKIAALEAEIKELKTQIENLGTAFKMEGKNTTKWFEKVFGDITELHELLIPALYTLFPGIRRTNKEIGSALRNRRPPSGKTAA